ncbi:cupin domain-containing protein [Mesorhizobium sp. M00.F.Ca.ET.216.01.1.1]|uniref:cupin domain-containing protein n=1 Tax=Mesorhizobium sp. M00.F.Ca.ET.216.01.1.1 TaxID=2500528 RepID=UPI000FD7426D|nr:cupin domain-containing protein [Mesorhizobium sp. M00.F.Ca.ET.216.01.1.1]TGQ38368.1 cupin domain-containing protein [Mesorhizobium sp. M00.F.Ca.ET.216.01.1.1]
MDVKVAATEPFVREPAAGSTLNVLGVTHIYKATGAETAGSFSLWEAVFPPGTGAPPHTHASEDEAFYVLSGELVIEFEGESAPHRVAPGGFFFGARGRRHAIRNVGDKPARVLVLCAASCGLDQMFAELDAATAAGMPEMGKLVAIAAKYGVTIEPPAA